MISVVYFLCFSVLFGARLTTAQMFAFAPIDLTEVKCPKNEMFHFCLNNCTNCQHHGFCPVYDCKQQGCDCLPNFVRLTPGGPCEPLGKCPIPECGENEVFRECGPICETCSTLNCRVIQCDHKCYCKQGYKRDFEGKCVPEEECPPKLRCSRREVMADEGPENEYCIQAEGENNFNSTMNKTQCYCQKGYKRALTGHCRDANNCDLVRCMDNEIYDLCPRKCNSTCRSYGDTKCVEDGNCYPGCFCKEGYYKNDFQRCVELENCEPGSNPYAPTAPPEVETTIPSSISSLTEDFTTTPGTLATNINNRNTPKTKDNSSPIQDDEEASEDGMEEEELSEDLPDEDVPMDAQDDETTQDVACTTPAPKVKPPKRRQNSKSQASSQANSHKTSQASSQVVGQKQSVSSKVPAAIFQDFDMDENE